MNALLEQDLPVSYDLQLARDIGEFYDNPLGYVMYIFPWGEKGGPLEKFDGPRKWQREGLIELGEEIKERAFDYFNPVRAIQQAFASGHGPGKSAYTAWLIKFISDTRPHSKGVCTATTSSQIQTKTWGELAKWHGMSLTKHLYRLNSSKGNLSYVRIGHEETWRCDGMTATKDNSEAFAGLHVADSTAYYLFDEASGVEDAIWEVSDGGLTDGEPWRIVMGNPTKNKGRFKDCFGRFKNYWLTHQIDSRDVEGTNKEYLDDLVEQWGEDSDFIRVRVRGLFPRSAFNQFIRADIVTAARKRAIVATEERTAPIILGIDIARGGMCHSTICTRIGRDARSFPLIRNNDSDTTNFTGVIIDYVNSFEKLGRDVDAIFIEGDGVGGPIIDVLKKANVPNIFEVHTGIEGSEPNRYLNVRTQMYGNLRDWLPTGCIPDDEMLEQDLLGIEYGFTNKKQQIALPPKDMMDFSPDDGDSLALTFAMPVRSKAEREAAERYESQGSQRSTASMGDYKPGRRKKRGR